MQNNEKNAREIKMKKIKNKMQGGKQEIKGVQELKKSKLG